MLTMYYNRVKAIALLAEYVFLRYIMSWHMHEKYV